MVDQNLLKSGDRRHVIGSTAGLLGGEVGLVDRPPDRVVIRQQVLHIGEGSGRHQLISVDEENPVRPSLASFGDAEVPGPRTTQSKSIVLRQDLNFAEAAGTMGYGLFNGADHAL